MAKKSIKLNAVLLSLKTVLSMAISLVTFPYISRILQVDAVGKHNFAVSIVSYFILLAELGIYTYAVREGTKLREHREKISLFASEMLSIQFVAAAVSLLLLFVSVLLIPKLQDYWVLLLILSAEIPLTALSRSWLYAVYEDYGYLTVTQFTVQVIALVLMFLFVHTPNDLFVYTITYVISRAGPGLVYCLHSRRYVHLKRINFFKLKQHMRPIILIFITAVSTTIYVNSDVTILGWLVDDEAVGLYSVAVKVYNIVKQVVTAVIAVAVPRLTLYVSTDNFKPFFNKVLKMMAMIILPAMTGLFLLSSNIIQIVAGAEYLAATTSMQILSIALGFALFACLYASGVLIPNTKEKSNMIATIISATINIILNFILIPLFHQDAAAFTTLIAELLMLIICYCCARKYAPLKCVTKTLLTIAAGCLSIVAVCLGIQMLDLSLYLETILCVVASVLAYCMVQLALKNEIFTQTARSALNMFIKKGQ